MANIMVVDDDPDVVLLVRHLLEKDGHQVMEAYHGADALKQIGIEPENNNAPIPDLFIIDVMMPVMDGYTLNMKLSANPRTNSVPILVLTVKDKMQDQFDMFRNVRAFLNKPFEVNSFRESIAKILAPKK